MGGENIHGSNTFSGKIDVLSEHMHSVQKVYPNLADSVTVTGAAGAWTLGAAAEIVPASTITSDFDIHWILVSGISANDQYQLNLYDNGDIIAEIGFTKTASADPVRAFSVITPIVKANSAITAKLASSGGGSDTCDVKLAYHTY